MKAPNTNIKNIVYDHLKENGFIDYSGNLRLFNKKREYFDDYAKEIFEKLKKEGLIVSYSYEEVLKYGYTGEDNDYLRITFAWYTGKEIEMMVIIEAC